MIKDILLLQPYISAYYEATKFIVEKQPPIIIEQENESEIQDSNSISLPERNKPTIIDDDDDNVDESFKEYNPNRKF